MKIYVGFRYLAENYAQPLVAFKNQDDALKWEKERYNNGYVVLEVKE